VRAPASSGSAPRGPAPSGKAHTAQDPPRAPSTGPGASAPCPAVNSLPHTHTHTLTAPPPRAGAEAPEDLQLDKKKLRAALKRQEQLLARDVTDDRKRGFNSLANEGLQVTEEDMEAYRLKKARADDPLALPGGGTNGYDLL
jgi:hypothetical protein